MYKIILFIFVICYAGLANAQNKKAPSGKKDLPEKAAAIAQTDSLKKDSVKFEEPPVPREFLVYTKKPRAKERMKLCINLVSEENVLNYCMNDSLCKDPEVSKILFQQKQGDTLYVLILIDAFTKVNQGNDDGRCDAGKETKLVFARWHTKSNVAKWKQKNVASCSRGITNMTKEPIANWDGASILTLNYHRGSTFYEIKFDPQQYQLGFQNNNGAAESDSK